MFEEYSLIIFVRTEATDMPLCFLGSLKGHLRSFRMEIMKEVENTGGINLKLIVDVKNSPNTPEISLRA